MITVNVRQTANRLSTAFTGLTKKQIEKATSQAINQTLLLGRTTARKAVKTVYNIPQRYMRGVDIQRSTTTTGKFYLKGTIYASTKPIPMDAFSPRFQFVSASSGAITVSITRRGTTKVKAIKRTNANRVGVSIEVKKGDRTVVPYAFLIPGAKPRVFARGEYKSGHGNWGFMQRHTREENEHGNDSVKPLVSVTIFGAVVNPTVKAKISSTVQRGFEANAIKALRRQAGAV